MASISAHPDAERRRRGPSRVEGEINLFDEQAFPSTGRPGERPHEHHGARRWD